MPWRSVFVKPRVFLRRRGVTVWHVYKNDDADNMLSYWFSLNEDDTGDEGTADAGKRMFDVRELPGFVQPEGGEYRAYTELYDGKAHDPRRQAIVEAIDAGLITQDECKIEAARAF